MLIKPIYYYKQPLYIFLSDIRLEFHVYELVLFAPNKVIIKQLFYCACYGIYDSTILNSSVSVYYIHLVHIVHCPDK